METESNAISVARHIRKVTTAEVVKTCTLFTAPFHAHPLSDVARHALLALSSCMSLEKREEILRGHRSRYEHARFRLALDRWGWRERRRNRESATLSLSASAGCGEEGTGITTGSTAGVGRAGPVDGPPSHRPGSLSAEAENRERQKSNPHHDENA